VGDPVINRLEPSSGPVGTLVTIFGQNLGDGGTVYFNNVVAFDSVQAKADKLAAEVAAAKAKSDVAAKPVKKPTAEEQKAMDAKQKADESATAKDKFNNPAATHEDPAAEAEMHAQVVQGKDEPSWNSDSISVHVPEDATSGDVVVVVNGVLSNGSAFKVIPGEVSL
jgi:hypothetical protein